MASSSKPIVDLTKQVPSVPINTNKILSGAFNALNNVDVQSKIPSFATTLTSKKQSQSNAISASQSFASGICDFVSFKYDEHRLKNNNFHNDFAAHFDAKLNENGFGKELLLKMMNPQNIKTNANNIGDYNKYNLFSSNLLFNLFDPSFACGIRDVALFNFVSRKVLKLECCGDVGIDILNFFHSLFIVLFWNSASFNLQSSESAQHGMLRCLQSLVPLQTAVWYLRLFDSLNAINKTEAFHIDFKQILNDQREKSVFFQNLIKRLAASASIQSKTWKEYLSRSQQRTDSFLANEQQRREQLSANWNVCSFNKQLNNYLNQLLLPKFIVFSLQKMNDCKNQKKRERVCSYFENEPKQKRRKMSNVCIDFECDQIVNFLQCAICRNRLALDVLTINECMHSFCKKCLNEYFEECEQQNIAPKCPSCHLNLGQGSIHSIKLKMCKEDIMKSSLMTMIHKSKRK